MKKDKLEEAKGLVRMGVLDEIRAREMAKLHYKANALQLVAKASDEFEHAAVLCGIRKSVCALLRWKLSIAIGDRSLLKGDEQERQRVPFTEMVAVYQKHYTRLLERYVGIFGRRMAA